MSYSKTIAVGSQGSLVITEAEGVATVKFDLSQNAGGGPVAGFAQGQVSAQVSVSAKELIDAGLALAAAKFPTATVIITEVQAVIDAEISKV